MQQNLTPTAFQAVQDMAQRYGVSVDAVTTLLAAVNAGGGSMAQFYHSELGGGGQWMRGGMTMVGDMFNSRLQGTVSGICSELSALLASQQVYVPLPPAANGSGFMAQGNNWWPSELGQPSSSGGQNDSRYAYFPNARRLAVSRNGQVTVYDTLDHNIGGVQQQQGGPSGSQSFSSQFGTFTVDSLPIVSGAPRPAPPPPPPHSQPSYSAPSHSAPSNSAPAYSPPAYSQESNNSGVSPSSSSGDILQALERLGQLHERGILTEDEFRSKKAELLARL
jgi:putative oligomerization/nucleic acid binding protein